MTGSTSGKFSHKKRKHFVKLKARGGADGWPKQEYITKEQSIKFTNCFVIRPDGFICDGYHGMSILRSILTRWLATGWRMAKKKHAYAWLVEAVYGTVLVAIIFYNN